MEVYKVERLIRKRSRRVVRMTRSPKILKI